MLDGKKSSFISIARYTGNLEFSLEMVHKGTSTRPSTPAKPSTLAALAWQSNTILHLPSQTMTRLDNIHNNKTELWDYLLDDGPHLSQLMRWLMNDPQVVISQPLRQRLLQWSPASPGDERTLAAANFLFVACTINEIVILPPAASNREQAGAHLEHLGLIQPCSAIRYLD
jgi:hypothetical protein